jgi:hypothetical protein
LSSGENVFPIPCCGCVWGIHYASGLPRWERNCIHLEISHTNMSIEVIPGDENTVQEFGD